MQLKTLYLHKFRNLEQVQLSFSEALNLICGANAQGKTNLLESIYLLATGRSFRTHRLRELVQQDSSQFFVEAHFVKHGVQHILKALGDGGGRRFWLNQTPLSSSTELLGLIPMIKVGPEEQELIKGGPGARRQFLDLQLLQADPLYVHHFNRYQRALKQRMVLLRQRRWGLLDPWEQELARSATYIVRRRQSLIEALCLTVEQYFRQLCSQEGDFEMSYRASLPKECENLEKGFTTSYTQSRQKDFELKRTSTGPHKDELFFSIHGRDLRQYGSEGQKRMAILALHLGAWELLKAQHELAPLFLIDDAFCGLDPIHTGLLMGIMDGLKAQSFVTTPSSLERKNRETSSLFIVERGMCQKYAQSQLATQSIKTKRSDSKAKSPFEAS